MSKMLEFITREREIPTRRNAVERRADFGEIYNEYSLAKAREQAARCSQCGVPFCQQHCPLHNNIPDWLMMAGTGRLYEAFILSSATNNMPEICGRICPQDRLCEGSCVIEQSGHGTVTIGAIEKHITDTAWKEGWVPPLRPSCERGQSVGIIGAGPAGMAAAEQLRMSGFAVTVYDRYDQPGGLLIYGIPDFKLEKHIVRRRTERMTEGGIEFVLDCDVGTDVSFAELRRKHDALLLATGVYRARKLDFADELVIPALQYLIASNRHNEGLAAPRFDSGEFNAKDRDVVVIGGGDTAMDCVRTAIRQGARQVSCLYRRDRQNMPGSQREVRNAEEEGVRFEWLASPREILSGADGRPEAVVAVRMRLGMQDRSGRNVPTEIAGSKFKVKADMVIAALGFDPEDLPDHLGEPGLTVNRWGAVKTDFASQMTAGMEGVFAAGDIVRGASLVVWAVHDGRNAAAGIERWLQRDLAGQTLEKK